MPKSPKSKSPMSKSPESKSPNSNLLNYWIKLLGSEIQKIELRAELI